ncbi:MAG: hypothetical protein IPM83_08060 [Ignavibacteria bacterium]|nr:hypothetical protein [Ignavibacteria bacterium]
MTKRTLEELKDAVNSAINSNDAASLMECADELDALATSEAEAVAHNARGVGFYARQLRRGARALAPSNGDARGAGQP